MTLPVAGIVADVLDVAHQFGLGSLAKNALVTKFLVGGLGPLGLFMIGRWLRRAEVVFRALSVLGIVFMALGALSLLGVVDINTARVVHGLARLADYAGVGIAPAPALGALAPVFASTRARSSTRTRSPASGRENARRRALAPCIIHASTAALGRRCERPHPHTSRTRGAHIHTPASANRERARELLYSARESYYAIQYSMHTTPQRELPGSQ